MKKILSSITLFIGMIFSGPLSAGWATERLALEAFFASTGGSGWINNSNWFNEELQCPSWFGLGCESRWNPDLEEWEYTVTDIWFINNGLSGVIPPEIGNLPNLKTIFISANNVSGEIPEEIGSLGQLRNLDFSGNQLSGEIPASLGSLTNLTRLNLSANSLSGNIPASIGSMSSLQYLDLWRNDLSGSIPSEIGDLPNLLDFRVYENNLSGSIPSSIGNLTTLKYLHLGHNSLTGSIPIHIGNLSGLEYFFVNNNSGLDGAIPVEIGNLINLKQFDFRDTLIAGSIPTEMGNMTALERLRFSAWITGTVPESLKNLSSAISVSWQHERLCLPNDPGLHQWVEAVVNPLSVPGSCDIIAKKEKNKGDDECSDANPSAFAGNPINLATGNKFQSETDFMGSGKFPLSFSRYYNSIDGIWRHNYSTRLYVNGSSAKLVESDGKELQFEKNSQGNWLSDPDVFAQLQSISNNNVITGYEFVSKTGIIKKFNQNGLMTQVSDLVGNKHTLTYNLNGNLISVENDQGDLLSFTYNGIYLDSMATPNNEEYQYDFSSSGLLQSVQFPGTENATKQYLYESSLDPTLLTGIIDENGDRYATWAYDQLGRAILSEHGDGTDKTEVKYNVGGSTTVTNALGKKTKYHFKSFHGVIKIVQLEGEPSDNCAGSNQYYNYDENGLLLSKTDWNGNQTTYTYNSKGQEIIRRKGVGTPIENVVITEWHSIFPLKTRVTEGLKQTQYNYDQDGRILEIITTASSIL